jgi:hypothetical protein
MAQSAKKIADARSAHALKKNPHLLLWYYEGGSRCSACLPQAGIPQSGTGSSVKIPIKDYRDKSVGLLAEVLT